MELLDGGTELDDLLWNLTILLLLENVMIIFPSHSPIKKNLHYL